MVIAHNLSAMNAQRQFNIVTSALAKSTEKLSSGYRINRAADDAAGLAISEKMRSQIRGLMQGVRNVHDGISFVQVADGALNEVTDMLQRINELAIKSANGTNTQADRNAIDEENEMLKKEMSRVFLSTNFNEKYIFRAPYTPEVEGRPNDFWMYDTTVAGFSSIGGIQINNVRYTNDELLTMMGVKDSKDYIESGIIRKGEYKINSADWYHPDPDEELYLSLREDATLGDFIEKINRRYHWSADESGVYVNKVFAADWDTLEANRKGNFYSFEYRGATISFEPNEGDDRSAMIAGINGDGFSPTSWDNIYLGAGQHNSLSFGRYDRSIEIRENNKAYICDDAIPYHFYADDIGVSMWDKDGRLHTETPWEDFHDAAIASTENNDGYPIIDWGLSNAPNDLSHVTLDDSALYTYTDTYTTFSFDYSVADEISKATAILIMCGTYLEGSIDSPIKGSYIQSSDTLFGTSASASLTFDIQRKAGRNFDSEDATFSSGSVSRNRGIDPYDGITKNYFTYTMDGVGTFSSFYIKDEDYPPTDVTLYRETLDKDGNITHDTRNSIHISFDKPEYSKYYDSAIKRGETPISAAEYSQRFLDYIDGSNGYASPAISISNNGHATQYVTLKPLRTTSSLPRRDTIVNPPKKQLPIQYGAEQGGYFTLEWSPLNLSIIGMKNACLLTDTSSLAAIEMTKNAIGIVNAERSRFGAYQNRMEHLIKNQENVIENTQAAESRIRDTNMSKEMINYSKHQILSQAGISIIAQANQSKQGVLALL